MDPSSGRDKNSNPTQPESENPFIRFRRFADSQVSSFLQGVIGLPSAFSKKSSEDNRWADIDEDLRRRDQLQERRQQLKDAEATKADGKPAEVGGEIPVDKSSQQQMPRPSYRFRPYWEYSGDSEEMAQSTQDDPHVQADLPLYSPVTRELFANLKRPESVLNLFKAELTLEDNSINFLEKDCTPSGVLRMTRQMAFHFLKSSPIFRSDYSLLPYLLFSPYSPLKLSVERYTQPIDQHAEDNFMYCSAFEDLIRMTQGRKDNNQSERLALIPWPITAGFSGNDNWSWISHLYARGMLQQKESVLFPLPATLVWEDLEVQERAPESDLDMFERLLASLSSDSAPQDKVPTIFEALLSRDEDRIRPGVNSLQEMIFQARERMESESRNIRATFSSQQQKVHTIDGKTSRSAQDTDRIVSTSTTTERTTQ